MRDREFIRRALEDLDSADVTADAWVQVYGRRLAEELSANQALLATARSNVEAVLEVMTLCIRLMTDLRQALTTFQTATHWSHRTTKHLKATSRRWAAARDLAEACHVAVTRFFPSIAGVLAAAPASLLHGRRSDPAARTARGAAAARLGDLINEVRRTGSEGPATDRFTETVDRLRVKMAGVELRREPGDDDEEAS